MEQVFKISVKWILTTVRVLPTLFVCPAPRPQQFRTENNFLFHINSLTVIYIKLIEAPRIKGVQVTFSEKWTWRKNADSNYRY